MSGSSAASGRRGAVLTIRNDSTPNLYVPIFHDPHLLSSTAAGAVNAAFLVVRRSSGLPDGRARRRGRGRAAPLPGPSRDVGGARVVGGRRRRALASRVRGRDEDVDVPRERARSRSRAGAGARSSAVRDARGASRAGERADARVVPHPRRVAAALCESASGFIVAVLVDASPGAPDATRRASAAALARNVARAFGRAGGRPLLAVIEADRADADERLNEYTVADELRATRARPKPTTTRTPPAPTTNRGRGIFRVVRRAPPPPAPPPPPPRRMARTLAALPDARGRTSCS